MLTWHHLGDGLRKWHFSCTHHADLHLRVLLLDDLLLHLGVDHVLLVVRHDDEVEVTKGLNSSPGTFHLPERFGISFSLSIQEFLFREARNGDWASLVFAGSAVNPDPGKGKPAEK